MACSCVWMFGNRWRVISPITDRVLSNEESSDPFDISNSLKLISPGAPALIINIGVLYQGSRGSWQSSVCELPARWINYFDLHRLNAKTTIVEALLVPTVSCCLTWEMYSQASIGTMTSLRRTGDISSPMAPTSTAFRHSISRNWRSRGKEEGWLHSTSRMFCPAIASPSWKSKRQHPVVSQASRCLLGRVLSQNV